MKFDKHIQLEIGIISNKTLPYEEALNYVAERGMRLPTGGELLMMKENGIELPKYYWTSISPNDKYALYMRSNGSLDFDFKYNENYVLPVKDI